MATIPDFNDDVKLMAASNDQGDFLGLLADTSSGLYTRGEGQWFQVTASNHYFNGAQLHYLDADALRFFDKLDAKEKEPTLDQMLVFVDEDEEPVAP
jgi:hypothetical protein